VVSQPLQVTPAMDGGSRQLRRPYIGTMLSTELGYLEAAMPRYFFDVKDGHRIFDASGIVCDERYRCNHQGDGARHRRFIRQARRRS